MTDIGGRQRSRGSHQRTVLFSLLLSVLCIALVHAKPSAYLYLSPTLTPTTRAHLTTHFSQLFEVSQDAPGNDFDYNFFIGLPPHANITLPKLSREGYQIVCGPKEGHVLPSAESASPFGLPWDKRPHGLLYGAYHLLRQLQVDFINPFKVEYPQQVSLSRIQNWNTSQSPHVDYRGMHYHTEHPLELHEMMNGWDAKLPDGSHTPFDSMLPEYESFLQWCTVYGINRLEWILLKTDNASTPLWSSIRRQRIHQLVGMGHDWNIAVGMDVGIAVQQQHDWALSGGYTKWPEVKASIDRHLHWMFDPLPGAPKDNTPDFLSTESGFTEFTNPGCAVMLKWMNYVTEVMLENWPEKETLIKCHCSLGQPCKEFEDPFTGGPLNFNYLPIYADPKLAMMTHTVQMYNFTQPAPVYGNPNFKSMMNFTLDALKENKRKVIYHGEGSYWVNVDIDVPLLLPTYGYSRMQDIRHLIRSGANPLAGQVSFNSGFFAGYAFQEVVTAMAAWNPRLHLSDEDAYMEILEDIFSPLGSNAQTWAKHIADLTYWQIDTLIYGKPIATGDDVVFKNGMAYLCGWDTWIELEAFFTENLVTQPNRYGIETVRLPFNRGYATIAPLLKEMDSSLQAFVSKWQATPGRNGFTTELIETLISTSARATVTSNLYEYAATWFSHPKANRTILLERAISAINTANASVYHLLEAFPISRERIAGWRETPSSYHFGYVFTAMTQYYNLRDYARATLATLEAALSPCYMNIIDPAQVIVGAGSIANFTAELGKKLRKAGFTGVGDCLTIPENPEYPFPVIDPHISRTTSVPAK